MRKILPALFIFTVIVLIPSKSYADCSGSHLNHSFFCPNSGYDLFGAAYNPSTENWGWYIGAKTVLFHPARWVWIGGVGFGVAFDQSTTDGRGPVLIPTLVPIEIGNLSVEVSWNKIKSLDSKNYLHRSRLIILAWNFNL